MSDDDYGSPEPIQGAGEPGSSSGRNHTPSHRKGPRFSWTPAYETTFFRSLCESVNLGLKDNHSFKSEAWDRACKALAERHGAYPNKGHLINKSDNARKKFRLWRGLREDRDFLYNPKNRTVTASDEAWRAHIEKEPLSKSLRNRPFEHEQFMEILFPDVVGSGGAPKRITKPRRKGTETMQDSDDLDGPGTNVMNLLSPGSSSMPFAPSQTPIHPPTVPSNGTVRPSSTTMQNRTSIASSSALTPPDDETPANQPSRKRFHPSNNTTSGSGEKRRRTGNNNYIDLTHSAQLMNMENNLQDGSSNQQNHQANNAGGPSSSGQPGVSRNQLVQESMLALSEFVRGFRNAPAPPPPTPRWTAQAMEIFFRDFADEDPDLQLKIGEKVLCDTNKATMFCTMPEQLRQHWVKRLRELHHRLDVTAGMNSSMNSNAAAAMNGSNGLLNGGGGITGMMQMGGPVNGGGMGRNGSQVG
ncbi:hypothetical protein N0V93_004427 [Gnomoniopsis smithogilvyi]|uniref:Myb/SANT-like domain-containing protein n=1 Tax=Gnomoniopsis smithogilvyi TaxID=1191159 RepID=A0A9W9CW69_9PEZI|nr:hypothetical protein N0V93_004427 [Gnomoniopsis smithogilvyi]